MVVVTNRALICNPISSVIADADHDADVGIKLALYPHPVDVITQAEPQMCGRYVLTGLSYHFSSFPLSSLLILPSLITSYPSISNPPVCLTMVEYIVRNPP